MKLRKKLSIVLYFLIISGQIIGQTIKLPDYKNSDKGVEERVEDLLARMTLEEKVEQISGEGFSTVGNVRLSIPKILTYDEQAENKADRNTVNFSSDINWAATFDESLIKEVGISSGQEARVMGANWLLNPCINILRSPFHGRSFEALGEDPYLVSRIAVAYIQGAQSQKVIACPKHFVANNQEWNRFDVDVQVDERALREIYFPAFKASIQEGDAWSLMTAYNQVLGDWTAESKYLLNDVLRNDWGYTGFTVSDWGGTHSTNGTALAGLDLEMPSGRFMGEELLKVVKSGEIDEAVIDKKVRNILLVMFKAGLFDETPAAYGGIANTQERRNLARKVAQESIVLLKNENDILPLKSEKVKSIAVIGPNANVARVDGGGSGDYKGYYQISPLQGILNRVGDSVEVNFERGFSEKRFELPIADSSFYLLPDSENEHGVIAEYFNNRELEGEPVLKQIEKAIDFDWGYGAHVAGGGPGSPNPEVVNIDKWSARWIGKFVSPGEGLYELGLKADNGVRLFLDGKLVLDAWTDSKPGEFKIARFPFEEGRKYDFRLEYYENWGSCRCKLGIAPIKQDDTKQDAINLAAKSDLVVLCMGLNNQMEGEGADREELSLPKEQVNLIKAVAGVNKNTIVILNNGTPITMSEWIDDIPALIDAFYPGQEGGNALADILFGDVSPSGRLPMTFPKKWEDSPVANTYPGERDFAYYNEGIFVGYRHYDKNDIEPLFPFGYGLSYTSFEYSDIKLDKPAMEQDDILTVSLTVKNIGTMNGDEVIQLYIHDEKASVEREVKSLKGFERVNLKAGESKDVSFEIDKSDLSFYDVKNKHWIAEPGKFEIRIGASSRDIRLKSGFELYKN